MTTLHAWPGPVSPEISVAVLGQDGLIYGYVPGELFRVAQDGSGFTVLHSFTGAEGHPLSLLQSADGSWYGSSGGTGAGTVFHFDVSSGKLTRIHSTPSGLNPQSLVLDRDGKLYGALVSYVDVTHPTQIFSVAVDGSNYREGKILPPSATGNYYDMQLLQGADGRMFGFVPDGGRAPPNGSGAIYEISSTLAARAIFTFQEAAVNFYLANKTGTYPQSMMLGDDGSFYGVTGAGGGAGIGNEFSCGTVFKYQPPAN
jgi:hypothetical protein